MKLCYQITQIGIRIENRAQGLNLGVHVGRPTAVFYRPTNEIIDVIDRCRYSTPVVIDGRRNDDRRRFGTLNTTSVSVFSISDHGLDRPD
jgi:hypothetical protein